MCCVLLNDFFVRVRLISFFPLSLLQSIFFHDDGSSAGRGNDWPFLECPVASKDGFRNNRVTPPFQILALFLFATDHAIYCP